MSRIIAAISWFEEPAAWLATTITSLRGVADHVVLVDGAYALYPRSRRMSGPEQHQAALEAAYANGLGITIHVPDDKWWGQEVEKRNAVFALANHLATPGEDWILALDADEHVTDVPTGLRERLAATDADVAWVMLWWREDFDEAPAKARVAREFAWSEVASAPDRRLLRADPSLRVVGAHHVWAVGDPPRYLRGPLDATVPALDMVDLKVEHRHAYRPRARHVAADEYYRRRDELGLEHEPLPAASET